MRRLAALAALALAAPVAVAAPSAAATALPMGRCSTSTNVVVAVDFGHWGGPVVRSCGSTPTTGYQLLNQGGFESTGTRHDGNAFVCRIASASFRGRTPFPSAADDPCVATPPASAYWSYWHADAGQSTWTYSQRGAMTSRPSAGGVDYWQFGATNVGGTQGRPSVTPAQVRATNAAPTTGSGGGAPASTRPGSRPAPPAGATPARPTSAAGTATSAAPAAGASASSVAPSSASSAASSATRASGGTSASASGATSSATSGTAAPRIVDATPASATADPGSGGGSVLSLVLVGGLLVVLGVGAAWTVRQRRRADAEL